MIINPLGANIKERRSTIFKQDFDALNTLLSIFAVQNPYILDCTFNEGKMWKGCYWQPDIKLDCQTQYDINVRADFRHLPFKSNSFDVMVFDPPYLPVDGASEKASKIYMNRYGITGKDSVCVDYRLKNNIVPCFNPFFNSARTVLKNKGIVLAKIQDMVHSGKMQCQKLEMDIAAREAGFIIEQTAIKESQSKNLMGDWDSIQHLRQGFSYWTVYVNKKGKTE